MSILSRPAVASLAARMAQRLTVLSPSPRNRFPEFPRDARELTIPTSVAPARAVVYTPATAAKDALPPVHVNFHGSGYVLPLRESDDPFCRYLAAQAGVVVINVHYALAPQCRFPGPPHQAFEVVRWVASHGAEHGWDGTRLSVGGQSAGGGIAAAVARQALEQGGPSITLQVLHYPPLDLATHAKEKHSHIAKPLLRPWMADVFDNAYVPDPRQRLDRLASPANPADTADLTGIAPALVLTAEFDILRAEATRYAERLRKAGSLVEHHDIPGVDHGYDLKGGERALEVYALIAGHVLRAANPEVADASR